MQTAGYFVASLIELTTGMQHGHDDFQGTLVLFLVHIHRDATSVVLNSDAVVLIDCNFNVCTESGQSFVDGVVHRLIHEVMEALFADITDVHGRTLAHGFKSFEDLDVTRAVIRAFLDFFFHFRYFGILESES